MYRGDAILIFFMREHSFEDFDKQKILQLPDSPCIQGLFGLH